MDKAEQIRRGIASLGKIPKGTVLATVESVDEAETTCELYDEDTKLTLHDVRLRPVIDDTKGLTLYPKVGTWCLAVRIEEDEDFMAVAFGEVDKWSLTIGTTVIEGDGSSWNQKADNIKVETGNTKLESSSSSWKLTNGAMVIQQEADGISIKNASTSLKEILQLIIQAVQATVVIQGTNPNAAKLAEAMIKLGTLLK